MKATDEKKRAEVQYVGGGKFLPIQAEYKLKKERWKRDMDSQDTPKSQRNQGDTFFLLFRFILSGVTNQDQHGSTLFLEA